MKRFALNLFIGQGVDGSYPTSLLTDATGS
jgi:hypothetical protein